MAIVKFGILISGLRGTVGGTTFSANKSGPFCRSWRMPVDPKSSAQQTDRAWMSEHSAEWLALTQAQRDDWDTYAADPDQELTNSLAETYYASGFNWYCRINQHLSLSGRARRNTFPTCATPATPSLLTCYCYTPISVAFHVRITYPQFEFSDHDVIVFVALAPRVSPLWVTRGFRGCHFTTPSSTQYTEFGLSVKSYFGQPPSGGKAFFKVQKQDPQGRRSAVATATANVITL